MNETLALKTKIFPMNHFKGAHGISTVSSITVSGCSPNRIDICSVCPKAKFSTILHWKWSFWEQDAVKRN